MWEAKVIWTPGTTQERSPITLGTNLKGLTLVQTKLNRSEKSIGFFADITAQIPAFFPCVTQFLDSMKNTKRPFHFFKDETCLPMCTQLFAPFRQSLSTVRFPLIPNNPHVQSQCIKYFFIINNIHFGEKEQRIFKWIPNKTNTTDAHWSMSINNNDSSGWLVSQLVWVGCRYNLAKNFFIFGIIF